MVGEGAVAKKSCQHGQYLVGESLIDEWFMAFESFGPMEGFDGRRLSRFLGLSTRYHEIVMVIAIGKKSPAYAEPPQWRRPLDATVTVL